MSSNENQNITALLAAAAGGDVAARNQVVQLLYEDLKRSAQAMLAHDGQRHNINATALVHECYGRLFDGRPVEVSGQHHFRRLAARTMRHLLIDLARKGAV